MAKRSSSEPGAAPLSGLFVPGASLLLLSAARNTRSSSSSMVCSWSVGAAMASRLAYTRTARCSGTCDAPMTCVNEAKSAQSRHAFMSALSALARCVEKGWCCGSIGGGAKPARRTQRVAPRRVSYSVKFWPSSSGFVVSHWSESDSWSMGSCCGPHRSAAGPLAPHGAAPAKRQSALA